LRDTLRARSTPKAAAPARPGLAHLPPPDRRRPTRPVPPSGALGDRQGRLAKVLGSPALIPRMWPDSLAALSPPNSSVPYACGLTIPVLEALGGWRPGCHDARIATPNGVESEPAHQVARFPGDGVAPCLHGRRQLRPHGNGR
jgi:hypothetical protein